MTNQQIQEKLTSILNLENICDMYVELKNFTKEYKNTDFFKQTKLSLEQLVQFYRTIYPFSITHVISELQKGLNSLDLGNLEGVLDTFIGSAKEINDTFSEKIENLQLL